MTKPTLADLTAFQTVARLASFRRAADLLGTSRSALSHAVRGLEADLGVRLLHRTTRSVAPTEAGARLLERLGTVLHDLDVALDLVADQSGVPSGTLRINTNKGGARLLMERAVPTFLTRYPGVELDLVSEGRLVDIVEKGFDAGVRLIGDVPRDMIAIPFGGETRFLAVAAPSYLDKAGMPATPDELRQHRCIRQRLPSGKRYRWEFGRDQDELAIEVPGALTLDDNDLLIVAAVAGLGIAYVPEPFARSALDDGRLIAVLLDWCPPLGGLALYYPGQRHVPSSLRAFVDVVKATCA